MFILEAGAFLVYTFPVFQYSAIPNHTIVAHCVFFHSTRKGSLNTKNSCIRYLLFAFSDFKILLHASTLEISWQF